MILEGIESCIERTVGVDPHAVGHAALERAVRRRMSERSVSTPEAYVALLSSEAEEARRLAAEVAVHETWFYRYPASFDLLVEHARARLAASDRPFRVLSVGCAMGQEPASAWLALVTAGLDPALVDVEGIDVGDRPIAAAREGLYQRRAVRDVPPAVLARWFTPEVDDLRLDREVVSRVRYRVADALDPLFSPPGPYDAIYFRNVLIYLRPEARRRILARLSEGLAPDGILFLGHAEIAAARDAGFVAVSPVEAFACRRGSAIQKFVRPPLALAPLSRSALPPAALPVPVPTPSPVRSPVRSQMRSPVVPDLVRAVVLADAGRLVDARTVVDGLLARGERSAALFHLLGTIEGANGRRAESEAAFTKALYLDPDHYDALVHLALAVEARGDPGYATRLRERARLSDERRSRSTRPDLVREDPHGDR